MLTRNAGPSALCMGVLALAGAAGAEDRVAVEGGFAYEPLVRDVAVEARLPASDTVRGCPGYMAEGDGLILALSYPSFPLHFYASAEGLAGLLVIGPDGIHRCTGLGQGQVAALRVDPLLPGDHRVSPLLAAPGAGTARVVVAERALEPGDIMRRFGRAPEGLAARAEPAFGRHAMPAEGVAEVEVTLSAIEPAGLAGPECYGQIDPSRPDAVLSLDAPEERLALRVRAAIDTTLVVLGPEGAVHCDDDSYGFDPEVVVENAAAGEWAIWAGIYSGAGGAAATLEIGRSGGGGQLAPDELGYDAPPAAGTFPLEGEGRLSVPVALSTRDAAMDLAPECLGRIDASRPDAVITLSEGAPALHLRARSADDTTLIVRRPDGSLLCDDDSYGFDPALEAAPAEAGNYAVWVGTFAMIDGGTAVLEAAFSEGAIAGDEAGLLPAFDDNPFEGRALSSAVEALEILLHEQGLAERLAFERLEPLGSEGVVLHGVTVTDPTDPFQTLAIERITVSDLDLEGLSATGEPDRFAIAIDGIDFWALIRAAGAASEVALPLPALAEDARLSLAASLLPGTIDGDLRDFLLSVDLERQFGFRLGGVFDLSERGGVRPALQDALTQEVRIEFENRGFLGQVIRAHAAQMGMEPGQVVAMILGGLGSVLEPVVPGSPQALLVDAAGEALADVDRRGVLRLRIATEEPQGLEALFEELQEGDPLADERLRVDLVYEPIP